MQRFCALLVILLSLWACSPNNIEVDNSLEKYFTENKLSGTFGMFNNGSGIFTIYNLTRFRDSGYLPASTFKIINSLVGLETGRANNDSMVIAWDGRVRQIENWNKDLTMSEAFRNSSVPWFQELARRIGKDTMQFWIDTLGYGSKIEPFKITGNLDSFWLDNSLKVTADEQLGLVKRLYFNQLPFQDRSMRLVKSMMIQESNSNYILAYKTGWGTTAQGNPLGWLVGWIEENKHPYFFVLQVESSDPNYDLSSVRLKILKDILAGKGFMEGKK